MKYLVRLMLCFMISFTLTELPVMKAQAGIMTTTEALKMTDRAQGEKDLNDFMKRDDVQKQLIKLGLNPEEASKRIATLSDAEVKKLSGDIERAQVGGDVGGILVLVLLVILIIYFAKRI